MTTPPSNPNQVPGLTPDGLANQLFDAAISQAFAQKVSDPREAARHVIQFLTEALFYAVNSSKNDVVVFLTETLIFVASSSVGGDEAARKELLKHIGDTIANSPPLPVNKPAAGKP
jgi:hypothetical protein